MIVLSSPVIATVTLALIEIHSEAIAGEKADSKIIHMNNTVRLK